MRGSRKLIFLLVLVSVLVVPLTSGRPVSAASDSVVHGILFYSPSCPHCHEVMTTVLPPLREQYGDQLAIVEVDTTSPEGGALWQAAVTRFEPPVVGVPMLIVGEQLLIGSRQIPDELPALIENHLAHGGVSWPDLPGVENVVGETVPPVEELGFWAEIKQRYTRDLAGNILSTLVLVGLLATLSEIAQPRDWQSPLTKRAGALGFLVPLVVGLIAALYLSYVETTGSEAVCGPVGDCNTVQQSQFAVLFGFLPIAVLGVMGYVGIFIAYVAGNSLKGSIASLAQVAVFLMSVFGLLFSTFLTFLEPFVIGATCAWCLTSAVAMGLIALLSAGPGWSALQQLGRNTGFSKTSP